MVLRVYAIVSVAHLSRSIERHGHDVPKLIFVLLQARLTLAKRLVIQAFSQIYGVVGCFLNLVFSAMSAHRTHSVSVPSVDFSSFIVNVAIVVAEV